MSSKNFSSPSLKSVITIKHNKNIIEKKIKITTTIYKLITRELNNKAKKH